MHPPGGSPPPLPPPSATPPLAAHTPPRLQRRVEGRLDEALPARGALEVREDGGEEGAVGGRRQLPAHEQGRGGVVWHSVPLAAQPKERGLDGGEEGGGARGGRLGDDDAALAKRQDGEVGVARAGGRGGGGGGGGRQGLRGGGGRGGGAKSRTLSGGLAKFEPQRGLHRTSPSRAPLDRSARSSSPHRAGRGRPGWPGTLGLPNAAALDKPSIARRCTKR